MRLGETLGAFLLGAVSVSRTRSGGRDPRRFGRMDGNASAMMGNLVAPLALLAALVAAFTSGAVAFFLWAATRDRPMRQEADFATRLDQQYGSRDWRK